MQIIWNSSTRAELLKFVDQKRATLVPDGSCTLKDSHGFLYEALSKETLIGNVYLRVYNDQPDFEISEPESFCVALVEFISKIVHNEIANVPESTHELETNHDEEKTTDDSVNKEDLGVVGNLQLGLTSLQVFIK